MIWLNSTRYSKILKNKQTFFNVIIIHTTVMQRRMGQQQQCTLREWRILKVASMSTVLRVHFARVEENNLFRIWKEMSLDDSLSSLARSKLAVWDYPVSDKYTKVRISKFAA